VRLEFDLSNSVGNGWIVNLRPGGGGFGESGGPSVGKGGESDVESRHFQYCSTRLCQLRADRLTHASKY
jgi:hypothetical protein